MESFFSGTLLIYKSIFLTYRLTLFKEVREGNCRIVKVENFHAIIGCFSCWKLFHMKVLIKNFYYQTPTVVAVKF